jgi:hypothetical protein
LVGGFVDNEIIEKIDLSDNEISDNDAMSLVRFIKKQAEVRDSALW